MKATIDVKKLLSAIRGYNSDLDLTGLKAYLLDVLLGEDTDVETVSPRKAPISPVEGAGEDDTTSIPLDTETHNAKLARMAAEMTASQKTAGTVKVNRPLQLPPTGKGASILSKKEAREKKRQEIKDLTNMSSKDILKNLTGDIQRNTKSEAVHGGKGRQFTNEGTDGNGGDDDLELG